MSNFPNDQKIVFSVEISRLCKDLGVWATKDTEGLM